MKRKAVNVCHIISGDLWAGAESQAYTLIVGLFKAKGISPNVIVFNDGILLKKLMASGIRVDLISEKSNNLAKMVWRIYNILRSTGVEILHTHGYKETFLGGLAARLCNAKSIVRTHHGKGVMDAGLKHRLIEKLNAVCFMDRAIAVSEDLKAFLISKNFKESIITVIHNGILADEVCPRREGSDIRAELNIEDDTIVIGTVGRLVGVKGHKYFLEGAKEILAQNENVVFVVAGDGPLFHELETEVKKLGITKNVRLIGFREDVFDIINIFDIFALTSLHEGVPMVLLEAMLLGKAIVATRVGGIPEIISDSRNGLLTPPMDSEAFAAVSLKLIDNKSVREQLAKNAKKDAESRYIIEKVAHSMESLYKVAL
ncbi:MAG: hypothetical protein AVO38_12790 [delta proteobacterium ML8_D]|nr:MAG: hypothetical protein AVO38_12790 [delta proteobacterium ML8_D]